jgi:hypothetical protein
LRLLRLLRLLLLLLLLLLLVVLLQVLERVWQGVVHSRGHSVRRLLLLLLLLPPRWAPGGGLARLHLPCMLLLYLQGLL